MPDRFDDQRSGRESYEAKRQEDWPRPNWRASGSNYSGSSYGGGLSSYSAREWTPWRGAYAGGLSEGFGTGDWSYDRDAYRRRGQYAGRGPKTHQRTDERIREDVCEMLTQHGEIDASDMEVHVSNGEVTLSGTVHDRQQKHLAEDVAEDVTGVKTVHNNVRVSRGIMSRIGDALGLTNDEDYARERYHEPATRL